MPSSGVRKLTPVAWRTNVVVVLQPQAERHEHLAGLDRELALLRRQQQVRLAILGVVGRDLLVGVQRQEIRQQADLRVDRRARDVGLRSPFRSPERRPTRSRRGNRRRRRTSGSRRRRSTARGLRRGRSRAPRSGCAHRACRTALRLPPPLGLTWQLRALQAALDGEIRLGRRRRSGKQRERGEQRRDDETSQMMFHDVPLLRRAARNPEPNRIDRRLVEERAAERHAIRRRCSGRPRACGRDSSRSDYRP